jgi:hypothetical protein
MRPNLTPFCTQALLVDSTVRTLDTNYYLYGQKILDGRFDMWTDTNTPRFWTPSISGASTVEQESFYINTGSTYSVQLAVDGSNSDVSVAQGITLFPGWYYTLTIYTRNSADAKTAKIVLTDTGANTYLQTDGTWDTSGSVTVPNQNRVWGSFTLTFRAANYEAYTLSLANGDASSSNIYVGPITLVEASTLRPPSQFPRAAKEAEIFCYDASVRYGINQVPTATAGLIMEPTDTATSLANPPKLKSLDEIRTFKAVREGSLSSLLMVNYKR